ncbi:MAG: CHAT domain-containing protein, partial [Pseudomonadota bacterium]
SARRAPARARRARCSHRPETPTARLMEGFYANLVLGGLGRAAALAKAQRDFLDAPGALRHPARWGAFIMLGEWR